MTDPRTVMHTLAARARQETAPTVDVGRQVTAKLRKRERRDSERPLFWFAAASLATAVVVVVISASLYQSISDPFWTLFQNGLAMLP